MIANPHNPITRSLGRYIMTMQHLNTTAEGSKAAALSMTANERLITARFRNPARMASVVIPADAWTTLDAAMNEAAAAYKPLMAAVLETAAKAILTRRIGDMQLFPTEIDDSIFSADAILAEATSGNSEWMTKEELSTAWDASATRKKFTNHPNYVSNAAYRKAVEAYKDMVLKLAGKTTQYEESELDVIVSKLDSHDLESELGAFILRRVEQIRNKPAKPAYNLADLL